MPGCGAVPFNRRIVSFVPHADLLEAAALLYRRGVGRLSSGLDLPEPDEMAPRGSKR